MIRSRRGSYILNTHVNRLGTTTQYVRVLTEYADLTCVPCVGTVYAAAGAVCFINVGIHLTQYSFIVGRTVSDLGGLDTYSS